MRLWVFRSRKSSRLARSSSAVAPSGESALPVRRPFGGPHAIAAAATLIVGVAALILGGLGWPFPSYSSARWCAVPLVLIAFVGRRQPRSAYLAAALAGMGGAYVALDELLRLGVGATSPGWIYVAGGLVVAGLSVVQLARAVGRARPFDPVGLIAIQLVVALVAHWLYSLLSGDGLNPNRYSMVTWATPFAAELPDLALGLAGVGLLVYRGPRSSLRRLGIVWPTSWQITSSLVAAIATLCVAGLANWLTYTLTPHAYAATNAVSEKTTGQSDLAIGLAYAVLAGIGEETLFRGALQPRAGIAVTALLFVMIHVQFGATPILGGIFVSGLVYGWLRQRMNTTTAIITHALHDGLPWLTWAFGPLALVVLMIAIVLLAAHAEMERWPRSVWVLVIGASLISVGALVSFLEINAVAWKICAVAGCAAMSIAMLVEARGLRSYPFAALGTAGWLAVASILMWNPANGGFAPFALFVISALAGVGAWYKLASFRYSEASEVAG